MIVDLDQIIFKNLGIVAPSEELPPEHQQAPCKPNPIAGPDNNNFDGKSYFDVFQMNGEKLRINLENEEEVRTELKLAKGNCGACLETMLGGSCGCKKPDLGATKSKI